MSKLPTIVYAFTVGALLAGSVAYGIVHYMFLQPHDPSKAPTEWVRCIRVELRRFVKSNVDGNEVDIPRRIHLLGNPDDLYLVIITRNKDEIKTEVREDTPIGNGLEWYFEPPLQLDQIYEVRLYDSGTFSDEYLDRVIVDGRVEEGGDFKFTLSDQLVKNPMPVNDGSKTHVAEGGSRTADSGGAGGSKP